MKAFVVDRYEKKRPLRLTDVPQPEVLAGDILVQIRAASVNPVDSKVRDGDFKLLIPHRMPFILGHDLAGTVIKVGAGVSGFKPGDEVYAQPRSLRIRRIHCRE